MMFHATTSDLNKCCFDLDEVIAIEEINSKDCKVYLRGSGEIVIDIDFEVIVNLLKNLTI